jgi:5-methylcytosine-specific restriction endonuclease McrA
VGGGRGEAQTNHLPDGTRMPRGSYALLSVTQADTSFVRSTRLKRQGRVGAHDWNELVAYYGFRCAHCGTNTRKPDKGHLDPLKKFELANLIPLCVDCHNWAQDDIIFGETGRVKAVRSERFLESADEAAKLRMYVWLKGNLKK